MRSDRLFAQQDGLHSEAASISRLPTSQSGNRIMITFDRDYRTQVEACLRTYASAALNKLQHVFHFIQASTQPILLYPKLLTIRRLKAAITIQRYARGFLARNHRKLVRIVNKLRMIRDQAARTIQRFMRTYHHRLHDKVRKLQIIRYTALVYIQRRIRGYLVRKEVKPLLRNPRLHLLVRWRHPAKHVSLAGTFTSPQWKRLIPMKFSRHLDQFYSTYFMDTHLPSEKYYMKFVVDGQWKCDTHYALEQDSNGDFNNVIVRTTEQARTQRSLSVHGLKKMEQSFSSQHLKVPEVPDLGLVKSNSGNLNDELTFIREGQKAASHSALALSMAYRMVAHPITPKLPLSAEGSADACFINPDVQTFGIADGVGEWQHYGLNPRFYSSELMSHCNNVLSQELLSVDNGYSTSPITEICRTALEHAYRMTQNYGSSTAILAAFRDNELSFASLGDSAIMILRARDPNSHSLSVIYKSIEQQHAFNCPYQLTHIPKPEEYDSLRSLGLHQLAKVLKRAGTIYQDSTTDAYCDEIPLLNRDIVIAATDGLFDNLYDTDIISITEKRLALQEPTRVFTAKLAQILIETAVEKSWDPTYKSPFARQAQKHGRFFIGGKQDDTTVIVGIAKVT